MALSLAVLVAACRSTVAPPPGWVGPFDAATVVARAVEAAGGPAAVQIPERVHTRARVVLHPREGVPVEGELSYWAEGAARERRELATADGHRLVQVIDGRRSIELEDGVPTGRDLAAEAAVRARYRGLLAEFARAGARELALVADPGADSAAEVTVERRYGPRERWQLRLDARTLLVTRIRRIAEGGGGAHVDEDLLSEHERFGARVLPRRQVTWRDGLRLKEAWLLEYDDDPLLDPSLFAVEPPR